MELILATPVEQLVPALLKWNNEELMNQVQEALAYYTEKVYDDSNIAEAKADKAKLNNFIKSLNDERIRIGKVYTSPYEKFKGEVDEVQIKVKSVVNTISESIDAYESKRQAEKKTAIEDYFLSLTKSDAVNEFVTLDKIFKTNWLNATASLKSVYAEIAQIVDRIETEVTTLKELKSPDETTLLTLYFRSLSLSTALMENTHLQAERERIASIKNQTESKLENQPDVATPVAAPSEDKSAICFKVTATREQFRLLAQFLKDNKMFYEKI